MDENWTHRNYSTGYVKKVFFFYLGLLKVAEVEFEVFFDLYTFVSY